MMQLRVPFHATIQPADDLTTIAAALRIPEKQPLAFAPWSNDPFKPDVSFSIAYNASQLFLQYAVTEAHLQAAHGKTNEPVYQDSCVEFFISFDEGASYYNFEFNCIGTILAGYGPSRTERSWLPENLLQTIRCQSIIQRGDREKKVQWELTIALPVQVFCFHSFSSLRGINARANFYKCGDNLPVPHFLAWSNIESSKPDFHAPQFFGTLLFV